MTYEEKLKYLEQLRTKVDRFKAAKKAQSRELAPETRMASQGTTPVPALERSEAPSLGRKIGLGARALGAEAVGLPGNILSLAKSGGEALAGGIGYLTGLPTPTPEQLEKLKSSGGWLSKVPDITDVFPASQDVKKGIDYISGSRFAPQTKGERYFDSVLGAIGSMALPAGIARAAATKGLPLLSKAASSLGSYTLPSLGGATGAGLGAQYTREEFPENPILQGVLPIVTGIAGSSAALGARGLGRSAANIGRSVKKPESLAALEKLAAKYNTPLSAGELAQHGQQQAFEEAARLGTLGTTPMALAKEFHGLKQKGFEEAVKKGAEEIAGGLPSAKGENIGKLTESLIKRAGSEKAAIQNAYENAGAGNIQFNFKDVKKLPEEFETALQTEGLGSLSHPQTYALAKDLKGFLKSAAPKDAKTINFNALENWRKSLNRVYENAPGNERYGMNILRRKMDDFIDNSVQNAMIEGDFKSLEKLKNARQLHSEWKKRYGVETDYEAGKSVISDVVEDALKGNRNLTNEQITNKLLGTSAVGFHDKAADSVKEIKKLFGSDSSEFMLLKSEILNKLLKPLEMAETGAIHKGDPAIQTFSTNLNKFIKENPTLSKEVFEKKDIDFLKDLGALGTAAFTKIKSKSNPSNSGLMASVLLGDKTSQFPGVKQFNEYFKTLKVNKAFTEGEKEKLALALTAAEETKSASSPYYLLEALKSVTGETGENAPEQETRRSSEEQEMQAPLTPQDRKSEIESIKNKIAELKKMRAEMQSQVSDEPKSVRKTSLMQTISERESSGNPKAVNKLGYLGEFQFGAKALEDLGLIKAGASKKGSNKKILDNPGNWTIEGGREAFLNNPELQRRAMAQYLKINKSRLMRQGLLNASTPPRQINALLSAAHLGGVGGVRSLLRGKDRKDAFGTRVSEYYKRGLRQ